MKTLDEIINENGEPDQSNQEDEPSPNQADVPSN